jgi:hypothetical protein
MRTAFRALHSILRELYLAAAVLGTGFLKAKHLSYLCLRLNVIRRRRLGWIICASPSIGDISPAAQSRSVSKPIRAPALAIASHAFIIRD